jgi:hypothetical protein
MGILSSIKDKIFGTSSKETAAATPATPAFTAQGGTAAAAIAAAKAAAAAATPVKQEPVDVEKIVEAAVKAKGVPSNWRVSIVDLLKALDLKSDFATRKELAAELKYSGAEYTGTAEQNIWLHKEVMKALAENGGKVPKELLK